MDRKNSKMRQIVIQHPLRNSVIMERIFHYLPVEDLKVCRMTLRCWHEPATRLLSQRIQGIVLHEKTEWKKFLKVFTKASSSTSTRLQGLSHIHPFHSFIFYRTYPEDPSWTPYKSAILDYMHSKVKLPKKTVWEEKFFSTFGLQILELRYCQFNFLNTERALREFREMLSTHCPNLSSLTIEFQKEPQPNNAASGNTGNNNSKGGTPTPSPSPSPSPSPQTGGLGGGGVFFPPNEESLKKSMDNLKKFIFHTDNKCWVNPNALEEFMSFMPSLEEFTYRYTGAKKQWAFVRRVDIIDIVCNLIHCGSLSNLKVLDLDSKGTVLSGEDFRKLSGGLGPSPPAADGSNNFPNSITTRCNKAIKEPKLYLTRFASQVFIKNETDWDHFCSWLGKFNNSLREIDIQVRSHLSQLPAEEQLPTIFPNVTLATMLLDNNFQVFLQRMPNVQKFCGVFDNELLPFCSATQNLSLDGGGPVFGSLVGSFVGGGEGNNGSSSSTSSVDGGVGCGGNNNGYPYHYQHHRRSSSRRGRSLSTRRSRSKSEDCPSGPPPAASSNIACGSPIHSTSLQRSCSKDIPEMACCENVKYLRIYCYEESMLDIEWKASLFRQIHSLETDIYYDQDLRLIWSHLHQTLSELIIHLKMVVPEQAFTGGGVPTVTFQELSKSNSRFGKGGKESGCGGGVGGGEIDYHDEEYLASLDEYPNLAMMKNLRILEIHTGGRQDAFGTVFSASLIIFGVSLLPLLERLVLPPAIPPKCLENSISYMGNLLYLRFLSVCDDTFNSVLPFHVLKCGLPELEIVVKYYQNDIKRMLCNPWRIERLVFPDFLPEHRSTSLGDGNGIPSSVHGRSGSTRSRFHLSKQCSAP